MIEVAALDKRDFIVDWRHFDEDEENFMVSYIFKMIKHSNVHKITIKKWPDKKPSKGK